MERPSEINPQKVLLMLMTSLITSQRDIKIRWKKEMDTDSAYLTNSQYIQSYWFSNKSNFNINIIYNISVITITIAITITLANFGKYAISDCPFITCQNLILASMFVGRVCYLPKFSILASMFVWPFVCLCVCVSVRNFFDTGHSFRYIVTKLGPSMYLCHVTMPIVFLGQRSNK